MLEKHHDVLLEIVKKYGTPVYVYFEEKLRQQCNLIMSKFKKYFTQGKAFYAYKANANPHLCKIIHDEGFGAEVISKGEYLLALNLVEPNEIVFNGVSKCDEEIFLAIKYGVFIINAESLQEVFVINEIAEKLGKKVPIGLRINPNIKVKTHGLILTGWKRNKFGIEVKAFIKNFDKIIKLKNVSLIGLHFHLGSQVFEPSKYLEAIKVVLSLVNDINKKYEWFPQVFDIGGGFGYSYKDGRMINLDKLFREVSQYCKELSNKVKVIIEPGRSLVAPAGILLTKVNYVKENYGIKWILVDAGMNDFVRPALYGAEHRVVVLNRSNENYERYTIAGAICESSDIFAKEILLPKLRRGDIIAILDVGAYGFSMASNYNLRARPPEILIKSDGSYSLIRERECIEDIFRRVPNFKLKHLQVL